MKYTFCFLLSILILSCNVEDRNENPIERESSITRTDVPTELKNKMQWVSFLTGIALAEDQDSRTDLLNVLDDSNNTISINDLLDDATITPNFKTKFLEVLDWYTLIICELGKPEPGPVPDLSPLFGCADEFLEYILVDNCLELYFPNGLVLDPVLPISTTAHPMTQADNNYGFLRYEKVPGVTKVMEKNINPEYLINKDIIVTRPIDSGGCDYSGWGIEDFTLFLAN